MQHTDSPKISYDKLIINYRNGLPQGNGHIGSLLWNSNLKTLCLSLDRYDIWDQRKACEVESKDYTYKNLIKLVKEEKHDQITKIFDEFYNIKPSPTKLPVGRILFDFGINITAMESELDIANGIVKVQVEVGDESYQIEGFIHSGAKFGLMKISYEASLPDIRLECPAFNSDFPEPLEEREHVVLARRTDLGYPPPSYHQQDNCKWFVQQTCEDLAFGIFIAYKRVGGNLYCSYTVATNEDGVDWQKKAKQMVEGALDENWQQCKQEHVKWWNDFNAKSSVDLPNTKLQSLWDNANYFLGSCSRKGGYPMPLQGLWVDDDGKLLPPWKGDYHHDLNTQMSYYHYLKANRISEGENMLEFLEFLRPQAKLFAEKFYDADGVNYPSSMSLNGSSLGGWPQYSVSITSTVWLCQLFVDYWNCTQDENFLQQTAYPFLCDTAKCVIRWLTKGSDGYLQLPLNTSPEIHDNTDRSWFKSTTNYDLSLLKYLFKNLSEFAEILADNQKMQWDEYLQKLPDFAIKDDILMVSKDEMLEQSHRHFSNCLAIYPLNLFKYDDICDRKVIDATVSQLEELGTGYWVGFSFVWMSCLYSYQRNGQGAEYQLEVFNDCICGPNGFCLNGDFQKKGVSTFHYSPFTLETNMGAADAICQMLLQSHQGYIEVFPAIPETWLSVGVSFENLRAVGAVLVSAAVRNGSTRYVCLQTKQPKTLKLKNPFVGCAKAVDSQGNSSVLVPDSNGMLEVMVDLPVTIKSHGNIPSNSTPAKK